MDGQLVHFEIPAQDGARAMEFWKSLFGWKFQAWEGPVEYHMLEGNEPGGAIYPDPIPPARAIVYFGTSDIDASIAKARELGGSADDKQPIPTIGWFARCVDTEGNRSRSSRPTSRCPRRARASRRVAAPGRTAPLGRRCAQDRACDELAAGEAQDVAVARVAGRDPDAVAAG